MAQKVIEIVGSAKQSFAKAAALQNTPEKINTDPHGAAWLIKVRLTDTAALSALMDAAAYEAYVASKGKEASA